MKTIKLFFVALPLLVSTSAYGDVGSAASDGSNRADACDKATKKAVDEAKAHIRFESNTKVSRAEKDAELQTGDCNCSSNDEKITLPQAKATCQVRWTVRWGR